MNAATPASPSGVEPELSMALSWRRSSGILHLSSRRHKLHPCRAMQATVAPSTPAHQPPIEWLKDVNATYFSQALGCTVTHCTITDAKELEQSEVAVATLHVPTGCSNSNAPSPSESSDASPASTAGASSELQVLLKRYHLPRLMARIDKPPEKWRISAASFANEYTFSHAISGPAATAQLHQAGVLIPEMLHAKRLRIDPAASFAPPGAAPPSAAASSSGAPSDDLMGWQYDFILQYLPSSSFYQAGQLDLPEATAAMTLLARFHAYFWVPGAPAAADKTPAETAAGSKAMSSDSHASLRAGLFKRGCWWRKELRPSVKYHRIPAAFRSLCEAFPEPDLLGRLDTADSHALMEKLAGSVDWINSSISSAPDLTLVHGDSKTSNLFFSTSCTAMASAVQSEQQGEADGISGREPLHGKHANGGESTSGACQAYAIDFQWTGSAPSGLSDVVYLLWGGVKADVLQQHEGQLLRHYWEELDAALKEAGKGPYSWPQCQADAQLELLAYFITALPQLMDGLTPELCKENWGKYAWLTHEMDPRVVALFCGSALSAARAVLP